MAGRTRRASRASGRAERSAWPAAAAVSGAASGGTPSNPTATPRSAQARRTILTGPTYRRLVQGGLAPAEAANLTAFLCGLPIGAAPWRLREVNQLLFLRELHRAGRFATGSASPAQAETRAPRRPRVTAEARPH